MCLILTAASRRAKWTRKGIVGPDPSKTGHALDGSKSSAAVNINQGKKSIINSFTWQNRFGRVQNKRAIYSPDVGRGENGRFRLSQDGRSQKKGLSAP